MNIRRKPTCLYCGEEQEPDDRFCGRCGSPVTMTGPVDDSWSQQTLDTHLLLVSPEDELPTRLPDPIAVVLGVAAVFLLGLSAWGLLRSSTAVVSGIGDELIAVLTVDPTEPEPPGTGMDGAAQVFETFEVRTVGPDEQLIVERDSGTSLLAASASAWALIDLDTGDRQRLEPQGLPVLISDNHLVVERDRSLWSIPVAELGHGSAGIDVFSLGIDDREDEFGFVSVSLSGPDEMLVVSSSFEGGVQVARLDLATGDRSGVAETPPSSFGLSHSGLYEAVGGGTFDVIDGSWAKLTDGSPVVAGPLSALVRVCGEPTKCRYEWLDRQSHQPLDRPVPEIMIEADRRQRFFVPVDLDSRVIAMFGPDEFTLVDVAKDRVLAFDDPFPDVVQVDVTRVESVLPFTARRGLVAVATGIGLELLDLDEDVRYRVEPGFFGSRPRRYLLVPS